MKNGNMDHSNKLTQLKRLNKNQKHLISEDHPNNRLSVERDAEKEVVVWFRYLER